MQAILIAIAAILGTVLSHPATTETISLQPFSAVNLGEIAEIDPSRILAHSEIQPVGFLDSTTANLTTAESNSDNQGSTKFVVQRSTGLTLYAAKTLDETYSDDLPDTTDDSGGAVGVSSSTDLGDGAGDSDTTVIPPLDVSDEASVDTETAPAVEGETPVVITPLNTNNIGNAQVNPSTAVVLAIDTSDSMWGQPLQGVKDATNNFLTTLAENIPVAVVTFSNRAEIAQEFTTDKASISETITSLRTGGVTALYDGSMAAVELASQADAENKVVILLSDGGEYGGQSAAAREDALNLAQAENVTVFTIGFGFGADRSFLEELATNTNGDIYEANDNEQLATLYEELASGIGSTSAVTLNSGYIEPLETQPEGTNDIGISLDGVESSGDNDVPNNIPPINEEFISLDIPQEGVVEELGIDLDATVSVETSEETEGDSQDVIRPEEIAPRRINLTSNVMPLTVDIPDDIEMVSAELFINGFSIATFEEEPITYELDTSILSSGQYNLAFSVTNDKGVVSTGELLFDVVIPTILPNTGGGAGSTINLNTAADGDSSIENQSSIDLSSAPRILLFDGETMPSDLKFSPEDGLAVIPPSTLDSVPTTETLGSILAKPASLIPAPIREAITRPNPELASLIVIIMSIILLPQGIFTLYWMLYTWNNPEKAEKSSSPKEFYEPEYSFTALVPARREEQVIYETIQAVNNVDYPEHLKETLVLIRDDDDDETIAETKRAIADIRQSYIDRGEVYPDNIHLITFTDGPRNKPNGLNRGLQAATKDVICIFDAEDTPHQEIYDVINTVMLRDEADVVQSGVQLMNFKSTWFSALNVLEYFFWFKSGLHCFTHAFNVTPLGGNTVFFKKSWLDRIGGWDEGTLTEDADVGIRLTAMGANIQIVYDAKHATQEETPGTVEQFVKQRTRWSQGFYEVFFKGDWLKLPTLKQKITAIYILLNSLLQAAIVFFLPVGIFIAVTQQVPVPIALLSWVPIYLLLTQVVINLTGIREFTEAYGEKLPFLFRLRMLLFYYPYQLMLSISAMRAVWRFVTNNSNWEKTAHSNLHRQSAQMVREVA